MIPTRNWKIPSIAVYVTVEPSPANALKEKYTWRVGVCHGESQVLEMIENDIRSLRNSLGGLIAPVDLTGRTYHVYRATWDPVTLDETTTKMIDHMMKPPFPTRKVRR